MKPSEGKINRVSVYQGIPVKGGGWQKGLDPVKNTVFFISDPATPEKTLIAKTDGKGVLCQVDKHLNATGAPQSVVTTSASRVKHLFRPPAESIALLPLADDKQSWAEKLLTFLKKNTQLPRQALTIEQVNIADLRAPKSSAEEDNTEDDAAYAAWLGKQQQSGIQQLSAFIIPKIRIAYFFITLPDDLISEVKVDIPGRIGEQKIIIVSEPKPPEGLTVYAMYGSEQQLPSGIWEIKVVLERDKLQKQKWAQTWFTNTHENDSLLVYYTLKEPCIFDIKNPLGEFCIVNINPLSLEECLIGQYPQALSHIIAQAQSYAEQPVGTVNSQIKPGLKEYFISWQTSRAAYNWSKDFAFTERNDATGIAKFILSSVQIILPDNENSVTSKWIDATLGGIELWSQPQELREQFTKLRQGLFSGASLRSINLKKGLGFADYNDPEVISKLENSIIGKWDRLDTETLIKIDIALKCIDGALKLFDTKASIEATANSASKLFLEAKPELKASKEAFSALVSQYKNLLDEDEQPVTLNLNVEFACNKADILPQYQPSIAKMAEDIINLIQKQKKDPKRSIGEPIKFDIHGYTCDSGSIEHNLELSLKRAEAVKNVLVEKGVPSTHIGKAIGHGEANFIVRNTNEAARRRNRRVTIQISGLEQIESSPSRIAIQKLEHSRTLTELKSIGVDAATMELFSNAYAMAIAVTALSGGTLAPIAAALGILATVNDAVQSIRKALDHTFNNSILAMIQNDTGARWQHLKGAEANMEMLTSDYKAHVGDSCQLTTDDSKIELLTQFRIRAEVLRGFMYLITRALMDAVPNIDESASAHGSYEERFALQLEQYQLEAYIENFILNQQWNFPLENLYVPYFETNRTTEKDLPLPGLLEGVVDLANTGYKLAKGAYVMGPAIDIGRYWAGIVANERHLRKKQQQQHTVNHKFTVAQRKRYFSLDKNYRLIPSEQLAKELTAERKVSDFKIEEYKKLHGIKLWPYSRIYSYDNACERSTVKANFQKTFPIHYFNSKNFVELAKQMRTSWGNLTKEDYLYIAVFYQDTTSWKPLTGYNCGFSDYIDWFWDNENLGKENIHHDTPVKILIILDTIHPTPVSINVCRSGQIDFKNGIACNITGPEYTEVAHPITEKELKPFISDPKIIKQLQGKSGCVITPSYACGKRQITGLKPMIGKNITFGKWDPYDEYKSDNFKYMKYFFKIIAGKSNRTSMQAPLYFNKLSDKQSSERNENDIIVSLHSSHPIIDPLLDLEFLESRTDKFEYPEIFKGRQAVTTLMRFLDPKNASSTPYFNAYSSESDIAKVRNHKIAKAFDIKGNRVKKYDWQTPVEFVVLLITSEVNKKAYEAHMRQWQGPRGSGTDYRDYSSIDWRNTPASVTLFNTNQIFGRTEGPSYQSHMKYVGKIRNKKSLSYTFYDDTSLVNKTNEQGGYDSLKTLRDYFNNNIITRESLVKLFRADYYMVNEILDEDEMYIFAMTIRPHYQAPNRKSVDTIRPFGDHNDDFEIVLDNLNSLGANDFNAKQSTGLKNYKFIFNCPKDPYSGDYPWAIGNIGLKLNKEENIQLIQGDQYHETYDDIYNPGIRPELFKAWCEYLNKTKRFSDISLFNS